MSDDSKLIPGQVGWPLPGSTWMWESSLFPTGSTWLLLSTGESTPYSLSPGGLFLSETWNSVSENPPFFTFGFNTIHHAPKCKLLLLSP